MCWTILNNRWNYSYLCVSWFFHIAFVKLIEITHIHFLDMLTCYHIILAVLVRLWTLICKIIDTTFTLKRDVDNFVTAFAWDFIIFLLNSQCRKNMQNKKPLKMTLLKQPRINISWHLTLKGKTDKILAHLVFWK